jgi:hypothetical protein
VDSAANLERLSSAIECTITVIPSPDIVAAILDGKPPVDDPPSGIPKELPLSWNSQRRPIG